MLKVYILMGLPGAGKSTFRRFRFPADFAVVSKDDFPNHRRPSHRQATTIREALAEGRSVVVDNTNPTIEDRASVIDIAREFDAKIYGYVLQATTEEAMARNDKRQGKQRVPPVAIFTSAKRWQPPTLDEGFDALFIVRVADGAFEVTPYSHP